MALVSDPLLQVTILIPHEQGQSMTFRPLTHGELREARARHRQEIFRSVAEMPAAVLANGLASEAPGEPRPVLALAEQFDAQVLLEKAIVAWSYGVPVSAESVALLDDRTAQWAVNEIVGMNVRTAEEGEGFAGA